MESNTLGHFLSPRWPEVNSFQDELYKKGLARTAEVNPIPSLLPTLLPAPENKGRTFYF